MEIIDKTHKPDYAFGYYIISVFSVLTFKKVNRIEKLKAELKIKKEENSNSKV